MPSRRIPSYRHYKPKNLGLVVLGRKYFYLGKYGTPESLVEYHRLLQVWLANQQAGRGNPGESPDASVNDVILTYWKHAELHYRDAEGARRPASWTTCAIRFARSGKSMAIPRQRRSDPWRCVRSEST